MKCRRAPDAAILVVRVMRNDCIVGGLRQLSEALHRASCNCHVRLMRLLHSHADNCALRIVILRLHSVRYHVKAKLMTRFGKDIIVYAFNACRLQSSLRQHYVTYATMLR
jgi:hypothetical protein